MKVAVVILNWNTRDFLEKFLPGVVAGCEGSPAEVVVADNASTDGSVELLQSRFPDVRRLILSKNYGFTGGYNRALRLLEGGQVPSTPSYDYYLLLNSDIEVPRGWLNPLLEHMESHPRCGACGPKLHSYYEKDIFEYAGAAGGFIDSLGYPFCRGRVLSKVETDKGQYDSAPQKVFWATGACLLVRSALFWKLGGLDERYFAHMEEIDLCWRMQLEGYEIWNVPASKVWHVGGGTLPQNSPFKLRLNYRNNLLMLSDNLPKTFVLKRYNKKKDSLHEARKASEKAMRLLTARMLLDGISALIYLLSFRKDSFDAVLQAHKEFRRLRRSMSPQELSEFVLRHEGNRVVGVYGGSIVALYLFHRKNMWNKIRRFASKIV